MYYCNGIRSSRGSFPPTFRLIRISLYTRQTPARFPRAHDPTLRHRRPVLLLRRESNYLPSKYPPPTKRYKKRDHLPLQSHRPAMYPSRPPLRNPPTASPHPKTTTRKTRLPSPLPPPAHPPRRR